MIDRRMYTKAEAKRQITSLCWILCNVGACSLWLDYHVWKPHFRWWHPATWLVLALGVIVCGVSGIPALRADMFVERSLRTHPYRKARRAAAHDKPNA